MRQELVTRRGVGRSRSMMSRYISALVVAATLGVSVVVAGGAGAETPAERCARETAAYNSAWAQSWSATHGLPASQAPPPPVPYVCHDQGTQTPTTSSPTVVAPPSLPTTTTPTQGVGPNITAHAPTDIPTPGRTPIVPVPGEGSTTVVPRASLPSGESPQGGVSPWPPTVGRHQAGCDLWDQSNCESARDFDTFKVCEAAGGYLSDGQLIAKFQRGIYMSCGDWRHIRDSHFQANGVSDQNRWDFLNCVSNAIIYGEDWDGARPPNVGYKYKNPRSGVWVYVAVRPGVGDTPKTIASAYTSGDSKDWGGCNAGGPSL